MVTNLKQKSTEIKRHRRTRYKRACQPIMEKFGCTAMQVAKMVEQIYGRNIQLQERLEMKEQHLAEAELTIVKLQDRILELDLIKREYDRLKKGIEGTKDAAR